MIEEAGEMRRRCRYTVIITTKAAASKRNPETDDPAMIPIELSGCPSPPEATVSLNLALTLSGTKLGVAVSSTEATAAELVALGDKLAEEVGLLRSCVAVADSDPLSAVGPTGVCVWERVYGDVSVDIMLLD